MSIFRQICDSIRAEKVQRAKADACAVNCEGAMPSIREAFPTPDERRGRDRQFYWNGFWLGLGIGVAFGSLIHQIFR